MARKRKAKEAAVPETLESEVIRHSRMELPESDHLRVMAAAKRYRLSVSSYIRLAVMERVEADERKAAGRG